MFCIKCGKQLPDEAAFCFACGAPVYNGNDAAPAVSAAPVFDNPATFVAPSAQDVLSVAQDARVDSGNFFIDGETMYFLTHGYHHCEHTQLWKSDLQGNNKQCIFEFDNTPYTPTDFIDGDDCYYIAKVDRLLLFQVEDENSDYFNYYYHLDNKTHGVIKDIPRLPYQISQDGKYFVSNMRDSAMDGGIILTLKTPYEALNNQAGKVIHLNSETLKDLYSNYENVELNQSDCIVYNDHQLLISLYAGGDCLDYLWARIDLFNMADYAILKPAEFTLAESGSLVGQGSLVLFKRSGSDSFVWVDTTDMSIKSTISMSLSGAYGSLGYFSSYNADTSMAIDLKTGNAKILPKNVKVFEATSSKNIRQASTGFYKYSYNNADTEIFFLSNAELFQATDDDYEILPMISLTYSRNFKPIVRNTAMDENVYTSYNTSELNSAVYEYLQNTNKELARQYDSSFFYSAFITLPDGKQVGFTYGHKQGYENERDDYYNLYERNLDGTYKYLGCGSRGGIENLKIYKNYAYWVDFLTYRYDFVTGEFLESRDEWLEKEYDAVSNKETRDQL